MAGKGLGSIIYKEFLQITKKKIKNPVHELILMHPTETREHGFGLGGGFQINHQWGH